MTQSDGGFVLGFTATHPLRARLQGRSGSQPFASTLCPFHDLYYLVGDEAMGFTMNRFCRFFAGGFRETEHGSIAFVEPVLQILHAMLVLHGKAFLLSPGNRISGQTFELVSTKQYTVSDGKVVRQRRKAVMA